MNTARVIALISELREKAYQLIISELERRGHPGVAPSHGALLANLYRRGPLPMNALAQAIGRKKNTVTVLVKKLEDLGYVRREPSSSDLRVIMVALTAKGEAFRADFDAVSQTLLTRVWDGFEPSDQEALMDGLQRLLANLG